MDVPPFDSRWAMIMKSSTFPTSTPGGKLSLFLLVARTVFYIHRKKGLWGPNALEFDPQQQR
ncbi:hypothetical protein BDN72DRAFT_894499 [Pluteus cervinus]|uniref:Uncharacterized protein n=1 Tax=Pluteus cervinus TaxID=181527 RepID=A0ACD3B7A0_9AGAR|nr:hypothetical protein BDN72DRAFT_894499 [Pluteus cervinus]